MYNNEVAVDGKAISRNCCLWLIAAAIIQSFDFLVHIWSYHNCTFKLLTLEYIDAIFHLPSSRQLQ